jgi:hypothetical protein
MPLMCELRTPGQKGDPVFVNPLNVLYVRAGAPGTTSIYFDNDQTINVALPVQAVIEALDGAMNTPR